MRSYLTLINQLSEIEQKVAQEQLSEKFDRNFKRIQNTFEEMGFYVLHPLGEKYTESRSDCEASIVGDGRGSLIITKVIKPIIYQQQDGQRVLVQKGIVIAE